MGKLSNKDLKIIDRAVVVNAGDAPVKVTNPRITVKALKGKKDYVPDPPEIDLPVVEGG